MFHRALNYSVVIDVSIREGYFLGRLIIIFTSLIGEDGSLAVGSVGNNFLNLISGYFIFLISGLSRFEITNLSVLEPLDGRRRVARNAHDHLHNRAL